MRELFRIFLAIWHARRIQDYFWGKPGERTEGYDAPSCWEDWVKNIVKRVNMVCVVNPSNKHWKVEARKRLLQCAAVSIAMIIAINKNKIKPSTDENKV